MRRLYTVGYGYKSFPSHRPYKYIYIYIYIYIYLYIIIYIYINHFFIKDDI